MVIKEFMDIKLVRVHFKIRWLHSVSTMTLFSSILSNLDVCNHDYVIIILYSILTVKCRLEEFLY